MRTILFSCYTNTPHRVTPDTHQKKQDKEDKKDKKAELRKIGYTWNEIATMAHSMTQWRALANGPSSHRTNRPG